MKESKKIKLSDVTELAKVCECYEALSENKLLYEEKDDCFLIFSESDPREADEKQTQNAAGRLCTKITSLLMITDMAFESNKGAVEVEKIIERNFLDKLNTKIILENFSKNLKLSSFVFGTKK